MGCCFTNIKKIVYKTGSESDRKGHMTNVLETLEKNCFQCMFCMAKGKLRQKNIFFDL